MTAREQLDSGKDANAPNFIACFVCGASAPRDHFRERTFTDIGISDKKTRTVILVSQHYCESCGLYFNEDISHLVAPRMQYSNRVVAAVTSLCDVFHVSCRDASALLHEWCKVSVSPSMVQRWVATLRQRRGSLLQYHASRVTARFGALYRRPRQWEFFELLRRYDFHVLNHAALLRRLCLTAMNYKNYEPRPFDVENSWWHIGAIVEGIRFEASRDPTVAHRTWKLDKVLGQMHDRMFRTR